MRRLLLALAAGLVLLLPAAATAGPPRFAGVALGNATSGKRLVPKHRFVVGDGYKIRLRDRRAGGTAYTVCLRTTTLRCARGRTGRKGRHGSIGEKFVGAPNTTGTFVYRWYVNHRQVASWRVVIGPGD